MRAGLVVVRRFGCGAEFFLQLVPFPLEPLVFFSERLDFGAANERLKPLLQRVLFQGERARGLSLLRQFLFGRRQGLARFLQPHRIDWFVRSRFRLFQIDPQHFDLLLQQLDLILRLGQFARIDGRWLRGQGLS